MPRGLAIVSVYMMDGCTLGQVFWNEKKFHNKIVQEAGEIGKIFSYYIPTTIFVGRHMNRILVLFSYSDTCCMRYCSGLKQYEMFSL